MIKLHMLHLGGSTVWGRACTARGDALCGVARDLTVSGCVTGNAVRPVGVRGCVDVWMRGCVQDAPRETQQGP